MSRTLKADLDSKYDDKKVGRKTGQLGPKKAAEHDAAEQAELRKYTVTISEAEIMFRMNHRTIQARIGDNVKPAGKTARGIRTYLIRDLAPYLVKPVGDMGEFIKNANPRDLPALLQKEYWNGQRARQAFLENEGKLWRTEKVAETLAESFMMVRTTLLLVPDQLALKTMLSDRQRDEIQSQIDQTLDKIRKQFVDQFGGDPRPGDEPGSIPPEPEYDDTFDLPAPLFEEEHDDTFEDGEEDDL